MLSLLNKHFCQKTWQLSLCWRDAYTVWHHQRTNTGYRIGCDLDVGQVNYTLFHLTDRLVDLIMNTSHLPGIQLVY